MAAPAKFKLTDLTDPFNAERLERRHKTLRANQCSYRAHWRMIRDYMSPRRGRYLHTEKDESPLIRGLPKGAKEVINGIAYDATRTLGAGLQGGLTSPARPWFTLGLDDADLEQYTPVAEWLTQVRDTMLMVMARSNYYSTRHNCYEEMGLFGTAMMFIEEDFDTVIRCRPFTIGEFCITIDNKLRPNGMSRNMSMTAEAMVLEFGWDALPAEVQNALDCSNYDTPFEIVHMVEQNMRMDPRALDWRGKGFTSAYYMPGFGKEGLLRTGGYLRAPFSPSRWATIGSDEYGDGPGMYALGDDKMLQKMEEKKLRGIDKEVDPPMNAPSSMRAAGGTVIPGGVNFIDSVQGQQSFTPAYTVQLNLANLMAECQRVEGRITRFFYNDLFLATLNAPKTMTATEAAQRYEEKLAMLGPTIERIQDESLDREVEEIYAICDNFKLFPPPPRELAGHRVNVQYISTLAQAQRMVGAQNIERLTAYVGAVAPLDPKASLRFNADEAIKEYGSMYASNPKLLRSDAAVAQLIQQQQVQQQRQQLAASAEPLAKATKAIGDTNVNGQNMLERMTGATG